MSAGFLSRISLRQDASVQAIARLLVPQGESNQHKAAHHLLWVLFGDTPDRKRDFLWRQTDPGCFLVLSAREPVDTHGLFDIESQVFAPRLKDGSRLGFMLRANATLDRKCERRTRSKRHDIVMDALYHIPKEQRAHARDGVVQQAITSWLLRQGQRTGFALQPDALSVQGCDVLRVAREAGRSKATFGVVNVTGALCVTDPALFVPALMHGFGRAKAFGCGLMLIRRAL